MDRQDLRDMSLLPDERRRLDNIEGFLRTEEPRMVSLFDMFTRLARGEGKPPPEERRCRADGPWRVEATFRRRFRRHRYVALAMVLAALIAMMALGLT